MNGKTGRKAAVKAEMTPAGKAPRELAAALNGGPRLSGSGSGDFTLHLLDQALKAACYGRNPEPGFAALRRAAIAAALKDIAPRDPLEGMLAAQLVAVHNAAMDCLRHAFHPEQTGQ